MNEKKLLKQTLCSATMQIYDPVMHSYNTHEKPVSFEREKEKELFSRSR